MIVRNTETNLQRVAQVVVLDPPSSQVDLSRTTDSISCSRNVMLVFPSYSFPQNGCPLLDHEVAFLSPLLAFNLNLHVSCLKSLVHRGKESLSSIFEAKLDETTCAESSDSSIIGLELEPL